MDLVILAGGATRERPISLGSGAAMCRAARELGHKVVVVDTMHGMLSENLDRNYAPSTDDCLEDWQERHVDLALDLFPDVIIPTLHGGWGENGRLQSLLEDADVQFAGSPSHVCFAAYDKIVSARTLGLAGIPVPAWADAAQRSIRDLFHEFGGDIVVKPRQGGSSVGVLRLNSLDDGRWKDVEDGGDYRVDEYLPGREFTVGGVGGHVLSGFQIAGVEIYGYDAKYGTQKPDRVAVSAEDNDELMRLAARVQAALELDGVWRIDVREGEERGDFRVLEVNPCPGMLTTSLLSHCASLAGWSYPTLVERLIETAHV